MQPVIDLTKEYGIVLDGGGARGAYQIGAWKALGEAGVKITAVAGTSVGALNGALICMGDVEKAQRIWKEIRFSKVMDVDDDWMERFFNKEIPLSELFLELKERIKDGGVDITPLKNLIHTYIDEEKVRKSGIAFYLLTFSLTDKKELELCVDELEEGTLEDYLLASASLWGFKNEPMRDGKRYMDGGVVNNVPLGSLAKRGYKNIISIRIHGPGREPKVQLSEGTKVYEISPRVRLGSILEFDKKRSKLNMKIGYYDAKRVLYGLVGRIYYIEETKDTCYYEKKLQSLSEVEKAQAAFVLKLPLGYDEKDLYMGMLEAAAKLLGIPKYRIYKVEELEEAVERALGERKEQETLPRFVRYWMRIREEGKMKLTGRDFLTLKDFTEEEILYLLDLAKDFKKKKKEGVPVDILKGKNVALIFEKTSTRTRCAFEVAAHDLGMGTTYLDPSGSQIGKKESIADTARVLAGMYDGIEYRGFGQEIVEELAKGANVPVWNGLTNEFHPTQMLADMLTIQEHFDRLKGLKLVYMGDARFNMGNSLMIACAKLGLDFTACAPEKYFPDKELVKQCEEYAKQSGSTLSFITDVEEGTKDADIICTDVWVSMGEPDDVWEERIRELTPYKVTKDVMANAKKSAIFLHCLPAFHDLKTTIGKQIHEKFGLMDMEVTDEVFESSQSKVFEEAENRMHTIKAVMAATLSEKELL